MDRHEKEEIPHTTQEQKRLLGVIEACGDVDQHKLHQLMYILQEVSGKDKRRYKLNTH